MGLADKALTFISEQGGAKIVFPFVNSISTAAAILGAVVVITNGIVAVLGAAVALSSLRKSVNGVELSFLAQLVAASPLHAFSSSPGITSLWRRSNSLNADQQESRSLACWLTVAGLVPFVLFLAGSVLPLGLTECLVGTAVPADGRVLPLYPLRDDSELKPDAILPDYDNITITRAVGSVRYMKIPGMADTLSMEPEYRTRWLGISDADSASAPLGKETRLGRGVGDFAFRRYTREYRKSNDTGVPQSVGYLVGVPQISESRLSQSNPEYIGNMLVDWSEPGGVSPVKLRNPVPSKSAGSFTVRSLWARPDVTCINSGFRLRIDRAGKRFGSGAPGTMEDNGALAGIPSKYPYDTEAIPPASWRAWKLAVVLAAYVGNNTLTTLRRQNSTLLDSLPKNVPLGEITRLLPPNINVTSEGSVFALSISNPKGIAIYDVRELATDFDDFTIQCRGVGGADIFNSTRRLPESNCWLFGLPEREIAPEVVVRDLQLCVARTNISIEDTVVTVENGAVVAVQPLRISLPATWALERPNVTVADAAPFWRHGACDPTLSHNDDFEARFCDSVYTETLQWPVGNIGKTSGLGDYEVSDALAADMAGDAWASVTRKNSNSGYYDSTGLSSSAIRRTWNTAAVNATNAVFAQRIHSVEIPWKKMWTDNLLNRALGHKGQILTYDLKLIDRRLCYDTRFFVQIPIALVSATCVFILRLAVTIRRRTSDETGATAEKTEQRSVLSNVVAYVRGQGRLAAQLDVARALTNAFAAAYARAGLVGPSRWASIDGSRMRFAFGAAISNPMQTLKSQYPYEYHHHGDADIHSQKTFQESRAHYLQDNTNAASERPTTVVHPAVIAPVRMSSRPQPREVTVHQEHTALAIGSRVESVHVQFHIVGTENFDDPRARTLVRYTDEIDLGRLDAKKCR
ncbi:hypothetical protein HDU86_000063 [Geranomyces michiganensis]|nr:hypothetical protein HDU86_000063 [Geranomyces michiganensis]